MKVFQNYAYYYDLFYGDKNYKKEAETVETLLRKHKEKATLNNILNIGSGTGRHDFEFGKLGYQMHGIDLSAEMIEIAKKNYHGNDRLSFEVSDARNYRTDLKYDAVISLFHVMSYQNSNDDIGQVFETANRALEKDGLFLFDAWYGPGVLTERPSVRVKEVENTDYRIIRTAQPVMHPNQNIVDVNYNIYVIEKETDKVEEIREKHCMRYFFLPEVEIMLKNAGFILESTYDCNTLEEPDYDSWTTYFIARKQ